MAEIIDVDFITKVKELRINNSKFADNLRKLGVPADRINEVEGFIHEKIKEMSDKIVDAMMGV